MKFGLQLSPYLPGSTGNCWDSVAEVAQFVDNSPFDSLWTYDHFLYEGGLSYHPFSEPVMECVTTLGALAALTHRIRLGSLVLGVPYRNPAMVAKMAATLDLISHGRLILGLGAGWHKREYEAYGWGEFEPVPVRMKRLEEAIRVTLALWTEQPAHFEGQYYRLEKVMENPKPIQEPHPPLLVGGCGKQVTLRLVAQYAQFCNVWGEPEVVKGLFEMLQDHCMRLNRSFEEITRSIMVTVILGRDAIEVAEKRDQLNPYIPYAGETTLVGTPDELIAKLRVYQEVGCQYTILRMPDWGSIEPLRLFAEEVIPTLQ